MYIKGTQVNLKICFYIQVKIICTVICCIDVPFKAGLTVYMVALPRFVVKMYPLSQV